MFNDVATATTTDVGENIATSQAIDSTHEEEGHGAHKPSPIGSADANVVLDASVPHIKKSVSHI